MNITPINHYNTNFRAKPNYNTVHKEMGKNLSKKNVWDNKNKINFKFDFWKHVYLPIISFIAVAPFAAGFYMVSNKDNNHQNIEQNVIATADKPETLLNNSTISFDEHRQKMNNAIEQPLSADVNNLKQESQQISDEYVKSENLQKSQDKQDEDTAKTALMNMLMVFGGIVGTFLATKAIINYICETPEGSHQYGDGNHMGGD